MQAERDRLRQDKAELERENRALKQQLQASQEKAARDFLEAGENALRVLVDLKSSTSMPLSLQNIEKMMKDVLRISDSILKNIDVKIENLKREYPKGNFWQWLNDSTFCDEFLSEVNKLEQSSLDHLLSILEGFQKVVSEPRERECDEEIQLLIQLSNKRAKISYQIVRDFRQYINRLGDTRSQDEVGEIIDGITQLKGELEETLKNCEISRMRGTNLIRQLLDCEEKYRVLRQDTNEKIERLRSELEAIRNFDSSKKRVLSPEPHPSDGEDRGTPLPIFSFVPEGERGDHLEVPDGNTPSQGFLTSKGEDNPFPELPLERGGDAISFVSESDGSDSQSFPSDSESTFSEGDRDLAKRRKTEVSEISDWLKKCGAKRTIPNKSLDEVFREFPTKFKESLEKWIKSKGGGELGLKNGEAWTSQEIDDICENYLLVIGGKGEKLEIDQSKTNKFYLGKIAKETKMAIRREGNES
jgi:hypothetical protein